MPKSRKPESEAKRFCALEESWHETWFGRHCGAVIRVREENALFRGKALRKNEGVSQRSGDCCNPRCVNQGQKKHFQKYRRVVWMPYVAKRTRRNDAEFGGIHNLDVPMLTESADDPPTNRVGDEKERKRNRGEDGKKRPVKKNEF